MSDSMSPQPGSSPSRSPGTPPAAESPTGASSASATPAPASAAPRSNAAPHTATSAAPATVAPATPGLQPRTPDNLAVRPFEAGLTLNEATAEEFLPSIGPWLRFAGVFLIGSFCAGIGLMAVWPYRVVVKGPGMTRPSGETNVVNAPRDGRVREIRILPNQTVRRGQVLAVLDPADLEGRRLKLEADDRALQRERSSRQDEKQASLQAAELEVEKAAAALRFAESEYSRYSQLVSSGAGSVQQMEEKAANLKVARSGLRKAEELVQEERSRGDSELAQLSQKLSENVAERAQLDRDLGRTLVRSPVDGIVFSVGLRNPLQVVMAGQELARIAPRQKDLLVKVLVPSADIPNVQRGQRADLRISGCPYPDFGTLPGRVISIAPDAVILGAASDPGGAPNSPAGGSSAAAGSAAAGNAVYEVTIQPDRTQLRAGARRCDLRLGMDLNADITTRIETVLQFVLRKARLFLTW